MFLLGVVAGIREIGVCIFALKLGEDSKRLQNACKTPHKS
jgi:hypothetical protein